MSSDFSVETIRNFFSLDGQKIRVRFLPYFPSLEGRLGRLAEERRGVRGE
jgi:hypothetical protein